MDGSGGHSHAVLVAPGKHSPCRPDPFPPACTGTSGSAPHPGGHSSTSTRKANSKAGQVYQPFVWRGWWDFGTGALGDIGCHAMSGIFSALKIEHAAAVELVCDTGDGTAEMFPSASTIRWDIPQRADMPPCQLFWYDGGHYPAAEIGELPSGQQYADNGTIIVGDKGKIALHGYSPRLMPETKMKDFRPPQPTIPRCEVAPYGSTDAKHFGEWVAACKGGRPHSQLRPRRPAHGVRAAGQSGDPRRRGPNGPVGRSEPEVPQPPRAEPLRAQRLPSGLEPVVAG